MFHDATLERIRTGAREVDPVKVMLTIVAAIPYALGWIAAKVCLAAWRVLSWMATAARVGWQEARKPKAAKARSGWSDGSD